MRHRKSKLSQIHEELKQKREEAFKNPNSMLYHLKSNYYRNNFSMTKEGVDNNQQSKFPLFSLIEEYKRGDFHCKDLYQTPQP